MRRRLFLVLFVAYAYFYQAGGWNQNSRFALVRAIFNEHTVRIDPYQRNTGDIAFHEGHYYSDKAPGLALAAVPVTAPVRLIFVAVGGDPETFTGLALLSWAATVLTVGLLTAWSGVLLFDLALAWGATRTAALFGALTYGLATPMWFMATLFIGHAISAACLVIAFAAAWRISANRSPAVPPAVATRLHLRLANDEWQSLVAGISAGWATVAEFPAAVPAVILAAWIALSAWSRGPQRAARIVAWLTAGALASASVLMVYQYLCFGSPFHLAYSSESGDFAGMHQGLFGITFPTWNTLYQVLISEYRGLLPLSPLMFVAPVGLVLLRTREASVRQAAVVAALIAGFYVFLNASYHYWEGGWSLGPRHLSPALPFLSLGLAPLWMQVSQAARRGLAIVALASFAISLVAVSTMVQPPANVNRPFRELIWPAFRDGDLALNTQSFVHHSVDPRFWRTHDEPKAAFNLGMLLGLDGHASLAPLFVFWMLCAEGLRRGATGAPAPGGSASSDRSKRREG